MIEDHEGALALSPALSYPDVFVVA